MYRNIKRLLQNGLTGEEKSQAIANAINGNGRVIFVNSYLLQTEMCNYFFLRFQITDRLMQLHFGFPNDFSFSVGHPVAKANSGLLAELNRLFLLSKMYGIEQAKDIRERLVFQPQHLRRENVEGRCTRLYMTRVRSVKYGRAMMELQQLVPIFLPLAIGGVASGVVLVLEFFVARLKAETEGVSDSPTLAQVLLIFHYCAEHYNASEINHWLKLCLELAHINPKPF